MKIYQTGYTVANPETLDGNAALAVDRATWYVKDSSASSTTNTSVSITSNGAYRSLPEALPASNAVYAVTVNTPTYTLDLAQRQFIEITLETNCLLNLINLKPKTEYTLKVNFNKFAILNLLDIFKFSIDLTWNYITGDYDYVLYTFMLSTYVLTTIDYVAPRLTYPEYNHPTSDFLLKTSLYSSPSDTGDLSLVGATNGDVSFDKGTYLNSGNIVYISSTVNLPATQFSISAHIRYLSPTNYGSILSKWSQTSKQFWLYITKSKVLTFKVLELSKEYTLTYDLSGYLLDSFDWIQINIIKSFNYYKLIINGQTVNVTIASSYISSSTANIVVGRLENSDSLGDVANKSFNGMIRDVVISTSLKSIYNYVYEYPINTQSNLLFLIQNGIKERKQNLDPSVLSTESTSSIVSTTSRNTRTLGVYGSSVLDAKHHLEYTNAGNYNLTGDCTIETLIFNPSNNPRGTLVYNGDASNYNYHLGIYDHYLKMDLNAGAHSLISTSTVPTDTWVHLAYTRTSNTHRLFINGELVGSSTYTGSLNTFPDSNICIKRFPSQSLTEASTNTSLYPSKSTVTMYALRILSNSLYNGTEQFLSPSEFPLKNL